MSGEFDPHDLRAQDAAKAETEEAARLRQRIAVDDLKLLMSQVQGRRFVWRLLERTGVFRNPFTGNSETYFRCGEMNIGQWLLGQIHEHCPDRYHQMVKEQQQE